MQGTKRCAYCNYVNPANQLYCSKCRRYLAEQSPDKKKITVWGLRASGKSIANPLDSDTPVQSDESYVICPQCGQTQDVINGVMPLSCDVCGYMYQFGIDKIVSGRDLNNLAPKDDENIKVQTPNPGEDTPSMPSPKTKETEMRLIIRDMPGQSPEKVSPFGDVIGSKGTVLKNLDISCTIKIFRAPTGWYINVLDGEAMVNGDILNNQIERRLDNGSSILVDDHTIFVEIV